MKKLYLLSLFCIPFVLPNHVLAQQTMESILRKKDPAAYQQYQQAAPELENMGIYMDTLISQRRKGVDQFFSTFESKTNQLTPAEGREGFREMKSQMKQPGVVKETTQPPSNLRLPVYKGQNCKYTYATPRLNAFSNLQQQQPDSLSIRTSDSPETVAAWYRTALRNAGWQMRETVAPGLPRNYFQKNFSGVREKWIGQVQVFGKSGPRGTTHVSIATTPKIDYSAN